MGFKFDPSLSTFKLAASALINDYATNGPFSSYGTSIAQGFGPLVLLNKYGGALKSLKVGFVLTTIRSLSKLTSKFQLFRYLHISSIQKPT